jgi:hypothetical protein
MSYGAATTFSKQFTGAHEGRRDAVQSVRPSVVAACWFAPTVPVGSD